MSSKEGLLMRKSASARMPMLCNAGIPAREITPQGMTSYPIDHEINAKHVPSRAGGLPF
jgi:hypothetical protein